MAAGQRALGLPVRGLRSRPWSDAVEIIEGDIGNEIAVGRALCDVDAAYYLVHSMGDVAEFRERDRRLATHFGAAAAAGGVGRIIYLGGLGDAQRARSTHLVSRREVGAALAASGVPVVELRAALMSVQARRASRCCAT